MNMDKICAKNDEMSIIKVLEKEWWLEQVGCNDVIRSETVHYQII